MAVIGDKETVTGFLLAGIGEKSPDGKLSNYLIVDEGWLKRNNGEGN